MYNRLYSSTYTQAEGSSLDEPRPRVAVQQAEYLHVLCSFSYRIPLMKARGKRKQRPHLQCNLEAATLHFDHLHAHDTRISIFSRQHQQHQQQEKHHLPASLQQGHSVGATTAARHLTRYLPRYLQKRAGINAKHALLCLNCRLCPYSVYAICQLAASRAGCGMQLRHVFRGPVNFTLFKPVTSPDMHHMPLVAWNKNTRATKSSPVCHQERGSHDRHSTKRWTPSERCRRRISSQERRWWRACF